MCGVLVHHMHDAHALSAGLGQLILEWHLSFGDQLLELRLCFVASLEVVHVASLLEVLVVEGLHGFDFDAAVHLVLVVGDIRTAGEELDEVLPER